VGLKFRPKEVTVVGPLPKGASEERRQLTVGMRRAKIGKFVPASASGGESAKRGDSLEDRGLARSVLADEEGDRARETDVQRRNERQVRRKRVRERSLLLPVDALQKRSRPTQKAASRVGPASSKAPVLPKYSLAA
jgi:hypothetical protein